MDRLRNTARAVSTHSVSTRALIVSDLLLQVLKAVVAEFDAGELITQRELVSQRVHQVRTASILRDADPVCFRPVVLAKNWHKQSLLKCGKTYFLL